MAYIYIYYDPRKTPAEPIYVGKGNKSRIQQHLRKGSSTNNLLQSKIKKIKAAGLEPVIEKYIDNISEEEAYEIEIDLIEKFGKICDKTGTLCNFAGGGKGGRLGFKHSEETKELYRKQRKGKKQTPAQYAANCARTHTEEAKKKISEYSKGRKRSPESIEKTRQAHLGSKRSEETKRLLSSQRKGKPRTEAQKQAFLNRAPRVTKKVKCLNNDKTYDSCKLAALDLGIKETVVVMVANGNYKSLNGYKGYKFTYV